MPSVTSHAREGQWSPSLGPPSSERLPRVQSRGSRARHQELPMPAECSHGKGTGSPGPFRGECRDSSCVNSTPQMLLCPASGARTFPEHSERCLVSFGLWLNISGMQVAGNPKMWLFLHLPLFFFLKGAHRYFIWDINKPQKRTIVLEL